MLKSDDVSLMKCLYLTTQNIESKWTVRYGNWDMIYAELDVLYPERLHWNFYFPWEHRVKKKIGW